MFLLSTLVIGCGGLGSNPDATADAKKPSDFCDKHPTHQSCVPAEDPDPTEPPPTDPVDVASSDYSGPERATFFYRNDDGSSAGSVHDLDSGALVIADDLELSCSGEFLMGLDQNDASLIVYRSDGSLVFDAPSDYENGYAADPIVIGSGFAVVERGMGWITTATGSTYDYLDATAELYSATGARTGEVDLGEDAWPIDVLLNGDSVFVLFQVNDYGANDAFVVEYDANFAMKRRLELVEVVSNVTSLTVRGDTLFVVDSSVGVEAVDLTSGASTGLALDGAAFGATATSWLKAVTVDDTGFWFGMSFIDSSTYPSTVGYRVRHVTDAGAVDADFDLDQIVVTDISVAADGTLRAFAFDWDWVSTGATSWRTEVGSARVLSLDRSGNRLGDLEVFANEGYTANSTAHHLCVP